MDHWLEIGLPDEHAPALVRAVAYYRHSAQDRQENSILIQQDQVRAWLSLHYYAFCGQRLIGLRSANRKDAFRTVASRTVDWAEYFFTPGCFQPGDDQADACPANSHFGTSIASTDLLIET